MQSPKRFPAGFRHGGRTACADSAPTLEPLTSLAVRARNVIRSRYEPVLRDCARRVMSTFTVADVNVRGELQSKATYSYPLLEHVPGALDLITQFATPLWRSPEEFEIPLAAPLGHITMRWRASARTAGIATLRAGGELASVSLLACGLEPEADSTTIRALQQHLLHELRDTRYEPAFALMDLDERPLLATISFAATTTEFDRMTIALADRCFAAAYFRTHDLA